MVRPSVFAVALGLLALACGSQPPPTPEAPPPPPPAPTAPTPPPAATDAGTAQATDPANMADPPRIRDPKPGPKFTSKKIGQKQDPAWAACHATFQPKTKDLVAEVQKSGKACEPTTKMKPVGAPEKGTQSETNPPQKVKIKGAAGKCYRVYAMADSGIKDLDLLVKDSAGEVAAEDSTDDSTPVLMEDGAFCFKEADEATLIVSVGEGKGTWALQVWSD